MIAFIIIVVVSLFLTLFVILRKLYALFQKEQEEKNNTLKAVNEKLNNINIELEKKVQERTQKLIDKIEQYKKTDSELKRALNHAEKNNFLKNAFWVNMSHEIRTPLNGIIGFSTLISKLKDTASSPDLYEYSINIKNSGEKLLKLLNNIIDISKIEAFDYEVKREVINISYLVDNIVIQYNNLCSNKGIAFHSKIDSNINIIADLLEVEKVIKLLLDNSIKYTEKGFISVSLSKDVESDIAILKIRDTGVGIDPVYLDEIFDAFRQESLGYNRSYEGAGLELPLSYQLLKLMNSSIDIESKKGEGTTVTVKFPYTNEQSIEEKQDISDKLYQQVVLHDLKVLVLEDDRINRMLLDKFLQGTGEVILAEDGDKALEAVLNFEKEGKIFDIMLFDINIPKPWNGISLMKEIKNKWPHYQRIPFIAQTAYAMSGDKDNLILEGFDAYISKPIEYKELYYLIHKKTSTHIKSGS